MFLQASPELADTLRDDQTVPRDHLLCSLGERDLLADVQAPRPNRAGQCLQRHPHPLCSL